MHARLDRHGLAGIPLSLRITGCPNGCARPYLAEIALIGKAPGRYNLLLGADAAGQRLNVLHRENVDEAQILDELDQLFGRYAQARAVDERFGDWLWRAGVLDPIAGRASATTRGLRMSIHDSKDDTGPGPLDLAAANRQLHALDAEGRVRWALEHLPGTHALSSSFGAQAAVSLHLVTRLAPGIPVVVVDTGYLFPETYQFIDELSARLSLNLRVHRAPLTPGWLEAREGRLWEQGSEGIERFSRLTKVEPMQHALDELGVGTWIAGLRRSQSRSRARHRAAGAPGRALQAQPDPRLDRSRRVSLPQAPRSAVPPAVARRATCRSATCRPRAPLGADLSEEQTRFHGLRRECGLHGLDG